MKGAADVWGDMCSTRYTVFGTGQQHAAQLFNLIEDPMEDTNIVEQEPQQVKRYLLTTRTKYMCTTGITPYWHPYSDRPKYDPSGAQTVLRMAMAECYRNPHPVEFLPQRAQDSVTPVFMRTIPGCSRTVRHIKSGSLWQGWVVAR